MGTVTLLAQRAKIDQVVMERIVRILQNGGVGVLATDTLYGLVGRASEKETVKRIYRLKHRKSTKPFIILISDYQDLARFEIFLSNEAIQGLSQYWPGPVSVILPCPAEQLAYLHRGGGTLAFRMPAKKTLRKLLRQTGPLVAPSANPESQAPAKTTVQARKYFGDTVDFYQAGKTTVRSSKLIEIKGGKVNVLRG